MSARLAQTDSERPGPQDCDKKRSSIQYQDHLMGRILLKQEMLQKGNKVIVILPVRYGPGEFIMLPAIGPEDVTIPFLMIGWHRHSLLPSNLHPVGS
jgi:hypothetical protein